MKLLFLNHHLSCIYFSMVLFFLFRTATLFLNTIPASMICSTQECLDADRNLRDAMNSSVDPCDNFYHYACGNFPTHHPNNESVPQTQFRKRYRETKAEILNFLRQDNRDYEPNCVHKARKFFRYCKEIGSFPNTTKPVQQILEKLGIPILPFVLNERRTFDYTIVLAKLARLTGIKLYFDVGTSLHPSDRYKNIISISSRKNLAEMQYNSKPLKQSVKFSKIVGSNESASPVDFIIEAAKLLCKNDQSSYCTTWNLLTLEEKERISEPVLMTVVDNDSLWPKTIESLNNTCEKPRVFTLKQIQDLTDEIANEIKPILPKLNWRKYIMHTFAGIDDVILDLCDSSEVEIAIDDYDSFSQTIRYIFRHKTFLHIESEIWFELISTLLPYLHGSMSELKNKIGTTFAGLTREEICAKVTVLKMDTAVSYMYTQMKIYEEPKIQISDMFRNIRDTLSQSIYKVSWIDEETKWRIMEKLTWVDYYILHADIVENKNKLDKFYQDVKIADNFYDSFMSIVRNDVISNLKVLQKRNALHDERNFAYATEVNAFYDPYKNNIMITGAITGGAFYRKGSVFSVLNYGSLGTIIGHELTHGFDFRGRCYDHLGNYKNWWNDETWKQFRQKGECFVKAYNRYNTTIEGVTQKGMSEATLCEDMSDNGGFRAALKAFKSQAANATKLHLPTFATFTDEQLFTLAYANVWCENPLPIAHDQARSNTVHSPNGVRVNGVLRNSKEFAEIWKCPKGSNMNPSDDKCTIW